MRAHLRPGVVARRVARVVRWRQVLVNDVDGAYGLL